MRGNGEGTGTRSSGPQVLHGECKTELFPALGWDQVLSGHGDWGRGEEPAAVTQTHTRPSLLQPTRALRTELKGDSSLSPTLLIMRTHKAFNVFSVLGVALPGHSQLQVFGRAPGASLLCPGHASHLRAQLEPTCSELKSCLQADPAAASEVRSGCREFPSTGGFDCTSAPGAKPATQEGASPGAYAEAVHTAILDTGSDL